MRKYYWADRGLTVTIAGRGRSRQLVLDKPFALVGSDPSVCDVVIQDMQQPGRCFVICLTPRGLMGVSLAYRQSPRRFKIVDDVRGVRIGGERIVFAAHPQVCFLPSDVDDDVYPVLRWRAADHHRRHTRLRPATPILFGRALPCPLRLDDSAVSAVHGFVYRHGDELWIVDLGSSNGTQVNQQTVRCASIQLGQSFLAGLTAVEYQPMPTVAEVPARAAEACDKADQPDEETACAAQVAARPSRSSPRHSVASVADASEDNATSGGLKSAELAQQVSELNRQVSEFRHAAADFEAQHMRMEADRADYETRVAELVCRVAAHEAAVSAWHAETQQFRLAQDAEKCHLDSERAELQRAFDLQANELRQRELAVAEQQRQFESQQQKLADDRQALAAEQELLIQEIETADERLLVRRIRLQRECQRWEDSLRAREASVEQREHAADQRDSELKRRENELAQQAAAVQRQLRAVRDRGRLPAVERATPGNSRRSNLSHEQFELANPLLESADFTSILDGVLDKDLEIDDD